MKIIELNEITDYIHLRQNSWHIVNDGISCFINPYVDKVIYKNQTINTSKIHDAFKLLRLHCYRKHKHKATLYFSPRNTQATAWYIENFASNTRTPLCISMCLSFLLNEDDCLFSMAHEFGHFDDYLSQTYNDVSSNKVLQYGSMFLMFVLIYSSLMIAIFLSHTTFQLFNFNFAFFLSCLIVFCFCEFINYSLEIGLSLVDVVQQHRNEYKADKFAYNCFNNVMLNNVFLYEGGKFHVSKSHPSKIQRIIYLKYDIKFYLPFFHFKYIENKLVLKHLVLNLFMIMLPKTVMHKLTLQNSSEP